MLFAPPFEGLVPGMMTSWLWTQVKSDAVPGVLSGVAKMIMAPRGQSPHFDVEATYHPKVPTIPCIDCDLSAEHGRPERLFVEVHALTSGHYQRIRAAGIWSVPGT
ncbi:MAG: hypothetical protein HOQ05_11395 [Corynebacteriales bacterium]|nr:hypothetical protein [Mycobacteriales bacterium]